MAEIILVAGATGALGHRVCRELKGRGLRVRALARDPARARTLLGSDADEIAAGDARDGGSLGAACAGAQAVFSCLGASVALGLGRGWRKFSDVDLVANRNLLGAARAAGITRFGYVSLFGPDRVAQTDYARAHEAVVEALRESGLRALVFRPTGFFSSLRPLVEMAARGRIAEIGDGSARTNPIHDADLAAACAEAMATAPKDGSAGLRELSLGGPDILTRRQIGELAFAAVGKAPRFMQAPAGLVRAMAMLMRPLHPRLAHLVDFFAHVTQRDLIAPCVGQRHIGDYFRECARG